ncbi:MAG TPA: ROK family transcriptional regulator [Clostridia bacterium]
MPQELSGKTRSRVESKRQIMKLLHLKGPMSRTDIMKTLSIPKPTITRIIEELLAKGLVIETGYYDTTVGRKPVFVDINPNAYYCIGVNISRYTIHCVLVDFKLNIVSERMHNVNVRTFLQGLPENVDDYVSLIIKNIEKVINDAGIQKERILGIGLGSPGFVNTNEGIIHDFALMGIMKDLPIGKILSRYFGMKVIIDNNANARALNAYWCDMQTAYDNMIFIICSEGIGSGIIVNGEIMRGYNNYSGEIGHTTLNITGKRCHCGKFGCLETYCSHEAIEKIVDEQLKLGKQSNLQKLVKQGKKITFDCICASACEGDLLCVEVFEYAAAALGAGIANLLAVLNTQAVFLSGTLFDKFPAFYDMVIRNVKSRLPPALPKQPDFILQKVSGTHYSSGAAALIHRYYFENEVF